MALPLSEADIISTSIQGMLYGEHACQTRLRVSLKGFTGLSVLMFILTFWILIRNRKKRGLNYYMFSAAVLLLLLATAVSLSLSCTGGILGLRPCAYCQEYICNVYRLVEGMVLKGPHLPQGLESYFSDVTETTFIVKGVLYNAQTLILDAVVVRPACSVYSYVYLTSAVFRRFTVRTSSGKTMSS